MTLDITFWVVFCLGWMFGNVIRLAVEIIAAREQPPEQLRKWFEE